MRVGSMHRAVTINIYPVKAERAARLRLFVAHQMLERARLPKPSSVARAETSLTELREA